MRRPLRKLFPFCLVGFVACDAEYGVAEADASELDISWQEMREACGAEELGWPLRADATVEPVSEACAELAGLAVGLDWETFGASPHAFEVPVTKDELVVAGLLVASADSAATVEDILAVEGPTRFRELLGELGHKYELAEDDPAGSVLWAFLSTRISSIQYQPALLDDGTVASYRGAGTVFVADIAKMSSDYLGWVPFGATSAASLLIHEAAHSIPDSGHVACAGNIFRGSAVACDATGDGAYGAMVAWTSSLYSARTDLHNAVACPDVLNVHYVACGSINESETVPACDGAAWDACMSLVGDLQEEEGE